MVTEVHSEIRAIDLQLSGFSCQEEVPIVVEFGRGKNFRKLIHIVNMDLGYLCRKELSKKCREQEDVLGLRANRLRLTAINLTNQESIMAVGPADYGFHDTGKWK